MSEFSGPASGKHGAPAGTQAAMRAVKLLKSFSAERSELSLTELMRLTGLTKATTHRLLMALQSEQLVERDAAGGKFRLGTAVQALAAGMGSGRNLVVTVHPVLEEIAAETGETTTLEVPAGRDVLILDEVVGRHVLSSGGNVGTRWPLHATSTGKVFVAWGCNGAASLSAPLARLTDSTIVDPDALRAAALSIRERGYATANNELEDGYAAVAAPVFGTGGAVRGAISVGGPSRRLDRRRLDQLGLRLKQAAEGLSL